jgi:hypothetical protein
VRCAPSRELCSDCDCHPDSVATLTLHAGLPVIPVCQLCAGCADCEKYPVHELCECMWYGADQVIGSQHRHFGPSLLLCCTSTVW